MLSNLFAQNDTLEPFFDLSLGRSDDIEDADYTSTWFIGSHSPEFAAIEDAPRIPQVSEHLWAGLVDGFMVNGRNISLGQSVVAGTAPGKLVAVLDSGTSNAMVPVDLADAIYGGIPGNLKVNGTWYVPCYIGVNVTIVIGYVEPLYVETTVYLHTYSGQQFPIHPLDTKLTTPQVLFANGTRVGLVLCTGSFQGQDPKGQQYDMLLGDVFLHNVYTS